jgi:hypothetical protein
LDIRNSGIDEEGWFSFSFQRSYWTFWSRFHGCVNKNETELTNPEDYEFYAIEINMRVCGTTHPMLTLKLLTEEIYREETGDFISKNEKKYYFATDNVCDLKFIGILPQELMKKLKQDYCGIL